MDTSTDQTFVDMVNMVQRLNEKLLCWEANNKSSLTIADTIVINLIDKLLGMVMEHLFKIGRM